jgi:hypothetical protein
VVLLCDSEQPFFFLVWDFCNFVKWGCKNYDLLLMVVLISLL